jgi:hypothetical protein
MTMDTLQQRVNNHEKHHSEYNIQSTKKGQGAEVKGHQPKITCQKVNQKA